VGLVEGGQYIVITLLDVAEIVDASAQTGEGGVQRRALNILNERATVRPQILPQPQQRCHLIMEDVRGILDNHIPR